MQHWPATLQLPRRLVNGFQRQLSGAAQRLFSQRFYRAGPTRGMGFNRSKELVAAGADPWAENCFTENALEAH